MTLIGFVLQVGITAENSPCKDWFDPGLASLVTGIKTCSRNRDLETGKRLHTEATNAGLLSNKYVANTLISMYSKCGNMSEARDVFNSMSRQTVVSWTTLLQGYVENGQGETALNLFDAMKQERGRFVPDSRTYAVVVSACAALASAEKDENTAEKSARMNRWLEKGRQAHREAVRNRCCDSFVEITLVDMYSKFGKMLEAQAVFENMTLHDVVGWTALIQGYVDNGQGFLALKLFDCMEKSPCAPNERTYVAALTACASLAAEDVTGTSREWLDKGRLLHSKVVASECCNCYVESALVNMYARCGSMDDARRVFDGMKAPGVIPWTALLHGYVENGESEKALELFERGGEGCVPNVRTYVTALTACGVLGSRSRDASRWLQKGRIIHSLALRTKSCNVFVETALVSMYAKCGSMACAREVFDRMFHRNVVTWNGLIQGYVDNSESEQALELISRMNVRPDAATFIAGLMACGNTMAIARGQDLHEEIKKLGLEKDIMVSTCLVDFYSKCGDMEAAEQVFESMTKKGVVTWNNLMSGYSLQGDAHHTCELLHKMKEQGVQPDEVTFVCVLSACSHAGMTTKGKEYFTMMSSEYGMSPTIKHYTCLVDLLGRANHLDEALRVLRSMPHEPDAAIWCTLLAACRKRNNALVGKVAYEALVKLDERHGAAYVLMAGIYDSSCCWEEEVRGQVARGMQSQTFWTDTGGKVHSFVSNNRDESHKTIY